MLWLLLNAKAVAVAVKLSHAIALWVVDVITEDGSHAVLLYIGDTLVEQATKAGAIEDVVAKDEADGVISDKLLADDESLGQSVGAWLLGVFKLDTQFAAVTEQSAEAWEVVRGGDDENLAYASEHQSRDGVIYHRLVKDRYQLFANAFGYGVEASA